ncbi:serine/threonine protein kinase [Streptomyces sp. me109]|uniref:serine/threonine-protein kinase n=1 Tax=Streptomyces sp. me109 TaxID=1827853 RepID=UPI0011CD863A|nr:serine/threonine-protein kinase [Streptomyces sp. me109]TXS66128.1 serine/threonine protein kinase [Streptomyces sp. me109]
MRVSNRVQSLQPGDPRRVGPYRVIGRLGSGGMGTVFAAVSATNERMAVKVIHPTQAADDEFRARFRREVQLSQRVTGPCLVPVHEADTEAALPWLATPFIPGPTLDRQITLNGPLTGAHLYALAAGTAAALGAIHAAAVVHRDVKPSNVILAPSGPQVLDFGIAHALDGTSVTRTGVLTGTPGWISPEHYRTGEVGPHGDVFAWGALIAYAATGRLPFGSGAVDAVAFRVMSAEPDLNGVPSDLLPLVEEALSKEPADRPSAAQLAVAGAGLLAVQATAVATLDSGHQLTLIPDLISSLHWDPAPQDEASWPAPARHSNRVRIYVAVAGAAAVLGSIGGAFAASQSSNGNHDAGLAAQSSRTTSAATVDTAAKKSTSQPESPAASTPSVRTPSQTPQHAIVPSPAYTRSDTTQPTIDEWADARVPATAAEKKAAQRLVTDAAPILQGEQYMDADVIVTFSPAAQTMFVTFGPAIYPEGQDYRDDTDWIDVRRGLMFGSCSEAQEDFHNDPTWPYGRAVVVYRESMASPIVADFRDVTHIDSCRV